MPRLQRVFVVVTIIALIFNRQILQPAPQRQSQGMSESSSSPEPKDSFTPVFDALETPYREDEIVALLTELYELLVELAYLSHDEITWPPAGGHSINEALCNELHISPDSVSLMKRLPYVDGDLRFAVHLFPRSEPLSFLCNDDILQSRDPETLLPRKGKPSRLRLNYILSHDIPLTRPTSDGMFVVLDTKANRIREVPGEGDPEEHKPDGWELERPDDPQHYRNWYPQHAPSFFRRFMEKIKALEVIPSGSEQFEKQYYGPEEPEIRNAAKETLTQTYGWPDHFRQEAWSEDAEEVWGRIISQSIEE